MIKIHRYTNGMQGTQRYFAITNIMDVCVGFVRARDIIRVIIIIIIEQCRRPKLPTYLGHETYYTPFSETILLLHSE